MDGFAKYVINLLSLRTNLLDHEQNGTYLFFKIFIITYNLKLWSILDKKINFIEFVKY